MTHRCKNTLVLALLGMALTLPGAPMKAQNPIVRNQYTADPSARVFNGKVYLFPSHDIKAPEGKNLRKDWFCMEDYHVFSSGNLTDWTDHGRIVSQYDAPWVNSTSYSMWAPDCVERNGKYYFYFPANIKADGNGRRGFGIGVAIADKPEGPYKAQPEPIKGVSGIDPNVLIDKDGQAYLYWSQQHIFVAKLKENMLEIEGEPLIIPNLPGKGLKEGPWVFERNGLYYLTFPHVENKTERLEYAIGRHPMGPFTMTGVIMDESPTGCWTNHHSILPYKGQWYLFYHHNDYSPNFDKNRSTRIDSLFFNEDGTIRKVTPSLRGVGMSSAWKTIEPDRYSALSPSGASIALHDTARPFEGWKTTLQQKGAWLRYNAVDFGGKQAAKIELKVKATKKAILEIRLNSEKGLLLSKITIKPSNTWSTVTAKITKKTPSKADLFLVQKGGGVLEIDNLVFEPSAASASTTTCINPVMWADVPDMSITRRGEDYYLISTTMHLMPGAPVMTSKDLVHWGIASYVFDSITDNNKYKLLDGTVYGRGQWASSIRFHNGYFYVLFSPNDQPFRSFIYRTKDPKNGRWELITRTQHFHDASLFFDDDGRVYVFYGTGQLRELKSDLTDIKPGGVDTVLFKRDAEENSLLEGSQVIKHQGKYYLLMISWPRNKPRRQVCYRADHITGPYEKKVILEDNFAGFPYCGQGCIVDDTKGNWYGLIFQDRNGVGRVPLLMPVRWEDGWPMLGDENGDVPLTWDVPLKPHDTGKRLVESDDFSSKKLKINWQWNHNPVNTAWSLTERKGYLRLKTSRVVNNLFLAPNSLTQRMEGPVCSGVAAFDVAGMKEGDAAGISAFNGDAGVLAVEMKQGQKFVVLYELSVRLDNTKAVLSVDSTEKARVALKQETVFLRVDGDFNLRKDLATFHYSLDNVNWIPMGGPYRMIFDYRRLFMGSKFALFNFATQTTGGYVDVDFFHYTKQPNKVN